jgi:small subunit ribosomal protein S7e
MSAAAKILNEKPSELELQVAQAFLDLESNSPELKADLRTLQFKSIREVGSIEIKT